MTVFTGALEKIDDGRIVVVFVEAKLDNGTGDEGAKVAVLVGEEIDGLKVGYKVG